MLKVNGEMRPFDPSEKQTLECFLEDEGFVRARVAVELNGSIVPRARYGETLLGDGDVLEVVSFVGGG